ncbi:MAG: DNA double-strand break repair nuclease NurA [Thermoproteota archaeon]|nr:DNA double-strand break repair nuclease NurA [Candidatus Brockarchaeota archaeon]
MASETAWSKLPIDLQEQFYQMAEDEAQRLIGVIGSFKLLMESVKHRIAPYVRTLSFGSSGETSIAAVDGSFSPRPAETIGAKFSVYAAGFIMVKGKKIVDEGYLPGNIGESQAYGRELFSIILSLRETRLERVAALKALERNPDLLLLDGSFLSFAYPLFRITRIAKSLPVPKEIREEISETTGEILKMTNVLLDSGKCAGIIKRGRSRAIGGWLSVKDGVKSSLVSHLDKQILHNLMSPPAILDYKELLGGPGLQRVYSRVSELLIREKYRYPKDAFEDALEWAVERLAEVLGVSDDYAKDLQSRLNRLQVKVSEENPPFELEVPLGSEKYVMEMLFSSIENFNMATGLPLAIDLIDENITLPVEFTREFVREVEARIVNSYTGNLSEIKEFFANMNPQKEL